MSTDSVPQADADSKFPTPTELRNVSSIIFRQDLYPRFAPDPAKIQVYGETLELLPPIEISQDGVLIDGYHRLKAHESQGVAELACTVTDVESDTDLECLSMLRNGKHGIPPTQDEKRRFAVKWWGVLSDARILETVSISDATLRRWTKTKREDQEAEQKRLIQELWMACYTQEQIAATTGIPQQTVNRKIADFTQIRQAHDLGNFRNFDPQIYRQWNFGTQSAEEV